MSLIIRSTDSLEKYLRRQKHAFKKKAEIEALDSPKYYLMTGATYGIQLALDAVATLRQHEDHNEEN